MGLLDPLIAHDRLENLQPLWEVFTWLRKLSQSAFKTISTSTYLGGGGQIELDLSAILEYPRAVVKKDV